MVEGMSVVVNIMLSLISVMSPPPALCNLSARTVVRCYVFLIIVMISACQINGRPLTKVSDQVDDASTLTPNHLLQLCSNLAVAMGKSLITGSLVLGDWLSDRYLISVLY